MLIKTMNIVLKRPLVQVKELRLPFLIEHLKSSHHAKFSNNNYLLKSLIRIMALERVLLAKLSEYRLKKILRGIMLSHQIQTIGSYQKVFSGSSAEPNKCLT